jgi:hypothetical protein
MACQDRWKIPVKNYLTRECTDLTSKCLLDLFKKLENILKKGNKAEIHWLYENNDENIRDAGADYETMIEVPFKIIALD